MKTLLLAFGLATAIAQVIVPLIRVESGREYLTRIGRTDLISNEVHRPYVLGGSPAGSENMSDYQDLIYLANITIGKPGQSFLVAMDTGTGETWVPSSSCAMGGCFTKNKFDCSASSTCVPSKNRFAFPEVFIDKNQYTGTVSGTLDNDTFCWYTQPTICDTVTFGAATSVPQSYTYLSMDGVAGLGLFGMIEGTYLPPFVQMYKDGVMQKGFFTVWMTSVGTNAQGQTGGQITFGDYDTNGHCDSSIHWVDLFITNSPGWIIYMNGGNCAGTTFDAKSGIFDTGASFLFGPQSEVDKIAAAIPADGFDNTQQLYYINCPHGKGSVTNVQDIEFIIDGQSYPVTKENYLLEALDQSQRCYIAMQYYQNPNAPHPPQWIMGAPFIRQFCTTFDMTDEAGRIGFSKALM